MTTRDPLPHDDAAAAESVTTEFSDRMLTRAVTAPGICWRSKNRSPRCLCKRANASPRVSVPMLMPSATRCMMFRGNASGLWTASLAEQTTDGKPKAEATASPLCFKNVRRFPDIDSKIARSLATANSVFQFALLRGHFVSLQRNATADESIQHITPATQWCYFLAAAGGFGSNL